MLWLWLLPLRCCWWVQERGRKQLLRLAEALDVLARKHGLVILRLFAPLQLINQAQIRLLHEGTQGSTSLCM
jgi:hypothetical protein